MSARHGPADFERVFGQALDDATAAFAALGARYMLIGGLAVGVRARERATKDVDFAVIASADATRELVAILAARGYKNKVHGAPGPGAVLRFHSLGPDGIERWIDVLVSGTEFEENAIARARPVAFLDRSILVATAEDLVIFKLVAGRLQDLADVGSLLEHGEGSLDEAYVDRQADAWGVRETLERIRAQLRERGDP